MIGRTYLERDRPVVVLVRWARRPPNPTRPKTIGFSGPTRSIGPRNVLIRRAAGELVVRPFRGLRRAAG